MRLASLLAVLLLASSALADDDLVDFDEQEERRDSFWARVSHPNHGRWRALVDEAKRAFGENDARRALTLLDEAVALEPAEAEGHYWRGFVLQSRAFERWADCADAYRRVLALEPGYRPPPRPMRDLPFEFDVGTCLALGGSLEESIPYYQRVLATGVQKPADRAVVYWNLGDSFQALGRLEEAIDAYRDGIDAQPTHAMLRLALGVAYDRDGQVALAVDAIQESLAMNPAASMTDPKGERALFVPAEDEDYYRGVAHKVARRRTLAIVFFKSYLDRAAKSPWAARARDHLAQLGGRELGLADVEVRGVPAEQRAPWQKPVLQAAGDLQRCLEGKPTARVLVEIGVPAPERASGKPDKKAPRQKPTAQVKPGVQVTVDGPLANPSAEAVDCVRKRAEKIKLPRSAEGSVVVAVGVIGR